MDIAATGGTKLTGVGRGLNGQASGAEPGPFDEIGALGLTTFGGFIEAAYHADLRWPGCQPLFERLRRSDPEVSVVRLVFGTMASGVKFEFKLPDKPSDDDKKFQEFGNQALDDLEGGITKWRDSLVSYAPFMGWSWWEAPPAVRKLDWVPPDHNGEDDPWRSKYNDGLIGIRRLAFRDPSSFFDWDISAKTGRLRGMRQLLMTEGTRSIPLDRSLHVTSGDANNPEGLSPLEAVWRLERLKFGLEVVQGIGFEHSAGHLSVKKTESGELSSTDKTNIRAAARAILTAQEGNYAAWPFGFDAEVIDSGFSAAPSILEAIRYYGLLKLMVFHMAWIAQSTLSGTGSYASVKDTSSLWLVAFNSMMSGFASQADEQIGKRLLDYNKDKFPGITQRPKLTASAVEKFIDLGELGEFFTQINGIGLGPEDFLAFRRKSGFLPETLPEKPQTTPTPEPAPKPASADTGQSAGAAQDNGEQTIDAMPTPGELAARYLDQRSIVGGSKDRAELMFGPVKYLKQLFVELAQDQGDIRSEYRATVYQAVLEYLVSGTSSTSFKNSIKKGVVSAFPDSFYLGYGVGGAEEVESDDDKWLTARMNAEVGYVDLMFEQLKSVKDEELPPKELVAEANSRADGYAKSLDGVYAEGLLRGQKNKMLTMVGDDGQESCADCRRYKGKRFSARKWLRIGIPGVPNNGYECNGWNCQHGLEDDEGVMWTV